MYNPVGNAGKLVCSNAEQYGRRRPSNEYWLNEAKAVRDEPQEETPRHYAGEGQRVGVGGAGPPR
jgi:hypothetical protein